MDDPKLLICNGDSHNLCNLSHKLQVYPNKMHVLILNYQNKTTKAGSWHQCATSWLVPKIKYYKPKDKINKKRNKKITNI